ncbi:ABC transporter substrate-binding protein [Agromyces aerolatus]|uniref:ABC transporter substrate-binding protein n=1 Tax=Agromyces sp. LY-1074 TaxID=3074080 RepID=UPI00285D3CF1|nr:MULTISPECIES: ABC transporter substrate-binding protein [unclassified Agromyces]MDR5700836.1 ABC transporter substrate-binding protein [Agromyces sp. LY-1074]MDR5707357.1 ABC transporter substrate-binding protein [Agromyces sp. LY-1358]
MSSSRSARALISPAVIGIAVLVLAGCGATADQSAADHDAVYRIPITDPGTEIDPLLASAASALAITGLVTEPLVSLDRDGAVNPRLADDWWPSEDGLTWTVVLRQGTTFNDGRPVTGDDVVATFDSIIAEDSLSPARSTFAGILASATARNAQTVEFALQRPFSDFPVLLTGTNTGILPAGYEVGTWLENPVGAGQFLLDEYIIGVGASYTRNPDYWNAEAIELDGVELRIYDDTQASILAFQAGEIDRIGLTAEVAAAVEVSEYDAISSGYNRFDGIALDVTTPPFDDRAAREALAWAVDRAAIVDAVYEGNADVANDTTFFPDYRPQPQGLEQRERDLDRVADLLGDRRLSFTITTSYQLLGEVLQQQLNEVPGFEVDLNVMSSEAYYADGAETPWLTAPVTVTNWAKRVPSEYLSLVYAAGSPWNASEFAAPDLDALAVEFDATTDEAGRQALVDRIGRLQWEEVPVIIPAYSKSQALQNPRVEGEFVGAIDFYTGYNFAGISKTQ